MNVKTSETEKKRKRKLLGKAWKARPVAGQLEIVHDNLDKGLKELRAVANNLEKGNAEKTKLNRAYTFINDSRYRLFGG